MVHVHIEVSYTCIRMHSDGAYAKCERACSIWNNVKVHGHMQPVAVDRDHWLIIAGVRGISRIGHYCWDVANFANLSSENVDPNSDEHKHRTCS